MKILVFDTETTGLPEKDASIYDQEKWPYIIQLSYIYYDLLKNEATIRDSYVKINNSIVIPEASYNKHHLTMDILNEKGNNIIPLLREFNLFLESADIIVGHNLSFDKKLVMVECFRNKINPKFVKFRGNNLIRKEEFCTMKKTTKFCNIKRINKNTLKEYNKTPSLLELYQILFPDKPIPNELHNSLVDILVTFKCFMKFKYDLNICLVNEKINNLCVKYNI